MAAVDVHEACARCHNGGTVLVPRKRRPAKAVRCPACKGNGAAGRLDDIPFLMPDPANRITLVAG